ncbi:MAG: methylated-DNA-protein-cysteine S-methyltransferase [bacterium]|nr:MAG: methylated-DNA-protein-cysteine S-methyltransferase [bacterium]
MSKTVYSTFDTNFGWCCIVGKEGRLLEIVPFLHSEDSAYSYVVSKYTDITLCSDCLEEPKEAIKRYLAGERMDFEFSLNLSGYTEFQRGVWETTMSISYGEIRTYSWVSKKLGIPKSSRAVGTALAKNPLPIVVPCHRVVRGNGSMGGYSAEGGIEIKAKLLKMEGHRFDSMGRLHIFY